ncbi:MAG: DUF4124 domain-containing protein [Desulfuromonadales bacterium]|jgi:hypothetical protein
MAKIAVFILLLAAFASGAAAGDVFSCRDAQGNLVFSDDPSNFPPGCRPVPSEPKGKGGGGLTIIPTPPAPTMEIGSVLRELEQEAARQKKQIEEWKEEARKLARDFQKASAERIPTLPTPKVQKGLAEMQRIERRAVELRQEVSSARMPSADRTEIENLLATIPLP